VRVKGFFCAASLCLLALVSPAQLFAQGRAWISHDCGNGVRLRLSSASASQGDLLELEIKTASPAADLKASWGDKALQFWTDASNTLVHRALVGVDLEQSAGQYDLALNGKLQSGDPLSCNAVVSVRAGHFAIEKLRVNGKFVELSPEDTKRAEEEQHRLRELFARATPERLWRGRFRMPLDGVHTGSNFGRRRVLNGKPGSPHSGLDLAAAAGTPVHASQRGRVEFAGELFFSGNTVILDHGLGLYTFYGHLESISVSVDDLVEAGAKLGRVGATGRATGPHLHWGMYVNAAKVNPLGILRLPTD